MIMRIYYESSAVFSAAPPPLSAPPHGQDAMAEGGRPAEQFPL